MVELNPKELELAREIISQGLVKAAESLSFFMNETITLQEFDQEKHLSTPPPEINKKDQTNIQLLITKVIGELNGVCCLIFSEEEANQLRQSALPPEILNSPEMMAEMSDGILLEVDNIISASVITQFSNILKVKIHGGVPALRKVNYAELEEYIHHEISNELYLISFKTSFKSSHVSFAPEFVWLFDNSFIQNIKTFATKQEEGTN
jgi:chemotaxis protein CheY-P-specific phosphatase CheC